MTAKEFFERYRGVRRTILVFIIIWLSSCVAVGLYQITHGGLNANDTAFLLGIAALLDVPMSLYYHTRGKSS